MSYFTVQNVNAVRSGEAIAQGDPVEVRADGKVYKALGVLPVFGIAVRAVGVDEITEYAIDGVIGVTGVTAAVGEIHAVGGFDIGYVLSKSDGPLSIVKLAVAPNA